ncbi:putative P-loop containing nucleoside triphosphate hydrolase [Rosa chinensis]|uniref:Putative P-loop containing nucleoside triphosphate hydrolase n=1 Tax=Rosa chinensis TaxID=74649 RepID=A0A2P6Q3R1_ROSCH|nr:putative P-loop containing nucleoside triphosphate hydrolase [Rosa chinensis]
MTLLLGHPSSGKSTLLTTLAGKLDSCLKWAAKTRKRYTHEQLDEVNIEVADYLQTLL